MEQIITTFTKEEFQGIISNAIQQAVMQIQKQPVCLLSVEEASKNLNVCSATIYNYIKSGKITPVTIGRTIRIKAEELNALKK